MAPRGARAKQMAEGTVAANFPAMGHLIWWSIFEVELKEDVLRDACDASIGRAFMPNSPAMSRITRLALEECDKKGVITRIPTGSKDVVAYTLHRKEINRTDVDLELEKEQTIVYHRDTNDVEIKATYKKQEIMDLIAKYGVTFTEEDVRTAVINYLKSAGATTMRDTGGIYFVTAEMRDKVRAFIQTTGGKFYSVGVYDIDTDKATMHELVKDELENDLQEAGEELKQFLAVTTDRKRIAALEGRLEKFQTIRAKAELYKDLLANDVEELNRTMTVMTDEVRAALSGEIAEYPQAKEFPMRSRVVYNGKAAEKYGTCGVVVGYWTDSEKYKFAQYVRVRFDKSDKVVAIGKNTLKIEGADATETTDTEEKLAS